MIIIIVIIIIIIKRPTFYSQPLPFSQDSWITPSRNKPEQKQVEKSIYLKHFYQEVIQLDKLLSPFIRVTPIAYLKSMYTLITIKTISFQFVIVIIIVN